MAEKEIPFTPVDFEESNWREIIASAGIHGYSSISQSFNTASFELKENGEDAKSDMYKLLGNICSMMLYPSSLNEPFKPIWQNYEEGTRSIIPDDLNLAELEFFEVILTSIDEPMLKGRVSDLLWLLRVPKDPNHAKIAIESYTSHTIDVKTWLQGIGNCWERAARICIQMKDYPGLREIEETLFISFQENHEENKFMVLWIAQLLDRLKLGKEQLGDIADRLFQIAQELKTISDYSSARSYFELSAKKYQQNKDDQGSLDSKYFIGECYELEADLTIKDTSLKQLVANSLYEKAIQAYRCIPVMHRGPYNIQNKIIELRKKLTKSGKASLEELALLSTPEIDIREFVEASKKHVAGKSDIEEALLYFSGLSKISDYETLLDSAKEIIAQNPLSAIFSSKHLAPDGRVIAITPGIDLSGNDDKTNQSAYLRQMHQQISLEVQLSVEGQILPALSQILLEHRMPRDFLLDMCNHSNLITENRQELTATGLWYGFEYNFPIAIHLLCPQVENIVRVQLKKIGAQTSVVDSLGIENEAGLSMLIDRPETESVFGKNLTFEIKALFADPLGPNLRNEVAHGLLDDITASSAGSVYAWWMVLRMIIRSIMGADLENL